MTKKKDTKSTLTISGGEKLRKGDVLQIGKQTVVVTSNKPVKPVIPDYYQVLRFDLLDDLVEAVNLFTMKGYEPVGGVSFSTKLGVWVQAVCVPDVFRAKRG